MTIVKSYFCVKQNDKIYRYMYVWEIKFKHIKES